MKIVSNNLSVSLANGGTKENRRQLDWYPTPPDVTKSLLNFLKLPKTLTIWEPACGDGSMSSVISEFGYSVTSTDLYDYGNNISGVDFRECTHLMADWIITNPPFSESEEFIRTAQRLKCRGFAFLLKSQYWHSKRRYDLFKEITPAFVLPLTWRPDFLSGERGGRPTMECIWTVWIDGATKTEYDLLPRVR